jgi:hypothetical protein
MRMTDVWEGVKQKELGLQQTKQNIKKKANQAGLLSTTARGCLKEFKARALNQSSR